MMGVYHVCGGFPCFSLVDYCPYFDGCVLYPRAGKSVAGRIGSVSISGCCCVCCEGMVQGLRNKASVAWGAKGEEIREVNYPSLFCFVCLVLFLFSISCVRCDGLVQRFEEQGYSHLWSKGGRRIGG